VRPSIPWSPHQGGRFAIKSAAGPAPNKQFLIGIKAEAGPPGHQVPVWQLITTAPFDRELELAVIDSDGQHALVFPCRRVTEGWVNAETEERIYVRPTHWRPWGPKR
jgi:hypothetical protein